MGSVLEFLHRESESAVGKVLSSRPSGHSGPGVISAAPVHDRKLPKDLPKEEPPVPQPTPPETSDSKARAAITTGSMISHNVATTLLGAKPAPKAVGSWAWGRPGGTAFNPRHMNTNT